MLRTVVVVVLFSKAIQNKKQMFLNIFLRVEIVK